MAEAYCQTPRRAPRYHAGLTLIPEGSMTVSRREFLQAGALTLAAADFASAASHIAQGASSPISAKALVFDTFGTVVDWRSSVAREVDALAKRKGVVVDGAKFADAWRAGYGPSMNRVRSGELPWTKLDDLHRIILDKLLTDSPLAGLTDSERVSLNYAWRRLTPWPDSVAGLTRLKKKFIIAPLSNGNIALMTELAKYGGLPWDCILGAELVHHYKPDPEVYLSAPEILGFRKDEVVMVAAHLGDLRAAKAVGLRTALVVRPNEYGPAGKPDLKGDASVDLSATDFNDLARQLGA
jgi:2-haloacid dehalogenase